jgi:hypothetical protein
MTAGLDIEAGASLAFQIGRLANALERQMAGQAMRDAEATRFIKSSKEFTLNGSGVGQVGFEGPKTGYVWTVRRITCTDSAAASNSVSGTAWIYGGVSAGSVNLYPENVEWAISPLPNVANFSGDQLVLQYGEHLYIQVTGGTANQVLKSSISYQLYRPATAPAISQV